MYTIYKYPCTAAPQRCAAVHRGGIPARKEVGFLQQHNGITQARMAFGPVPQGAACRVKRGYTLREIAGEYLAVPVSDEEGAAQCLAILNGTGKFLFDLLAEEKTPAELLQTMLDTFEVSPREAETDIAEFLHILAQNGLLHINPRPEAMG